MEDELAFLLQRLEQERSRAETSAEPEVRTIHSRMADHYQARIEAMTVPGTTMH